MTRDILESLRDDLLSTICSIRVEDDLSDFDKGRLEGYTQMYWKIVNKVGTGRNND